MSGWPIDLWPILDYYGLCTSMYLRVPTNPFMTEFALMNNAPAASTAWHLELETKPDFDRAMERVYAWYQQVVIDRPPVRFTGTMLCTTKQTRWPKLATPI